ncbi:hypothetical protein, conserved [Eimeria maxima]|uniref:Uncharacterized protein n=1 Tax=Eimeria maxima TaxID=5804 RepID=U6LWH3_EIMMA|nr:hypothetical protein, conserved [Eimeria maxima]CDJ56076.1 hypothetical protein, conserved [Eimeria maxima]
MSPLQSAALQQPQGLSGYSSPSVEPPNPAEVRETGAPPHLPRPSVDSPPEMVLPLVPPAIPPVVPQESENLQQNQQQKQKQLQVQQQQQQQQRQQQDCPLPQEATANDKQQTHNEIQPPNSSHPQQVQEKQQNALEKPPQSQQHHQQKEHQGEQEYQEHHHHQQDGLESQQQLLLLREVGNGSVQHTPHYRNVSQQQEVREQQTQTREIHRPNEAPMQQQQRWQQRGQGQPALMVFLTEQQQGFPVQQQGTQGLQQLHTPEEQHQSEKPAGDQVELLLEAAEQQRSELRQLVQQNESCSIGHYEQQHSQDQQQQHEQQQQPEQQQQHQKQQHQQKQPQQQQQLRQQDLNEQQYEPPSGVDGGQPAADEGRVPCYGSPESHSTLSREISLSESESSDPSTTRSPIPEPNAQQPQRPTYATGDSSSTTAEAVAAAAREGISVLHNQLSSSIQEALARQAAEATNSQEAQKPLLEQRQQQQQQLRVQRHAELHQQPQQQVPQHQRQPNNRIPIAEPLSHTVETRETAEPCHLMDILWRQRHQQQKQTRLVGAAGTPAAAVAVVATPRARGQPAAHSASVFAMRSPPPVQEESPAAVVQQQPHSASSSCTVALGGPSVEGKLQGPPAPSRGLSGAAKQTAGIQASLLRPAAALLAAAAAAHAEPHGLSGNKNSAAEGAKHKSLQPAAALPAPSAGSVPKKSQTRPAATATVARETGTTTKAASAVAAPKGATRSSATVATAKAPARATANATDSISSETAEGGDTTVSPPVAIVNKVAGAAAERSANAPPRKSSSGFIVLRGAAAATSEPRAPVVAAAAELLLRQAPRRAGRAGQSEMPPAKKRRQLLEQHSEQQLQPQLHRSQKQDQKAAGLSGIDKRAIPQLAQPRKLAPTTGLSACSSRSSCFTDSSSSDGTGSSRSRRSSDSCSGILSGSSRSINSPSSRSENSSNSPSNSNSSSPCRSVKQRKTTAVKLWGRSNGAGSVSSLRRRMLGKLLRRRTLTVSSSAIRKVPCGRNTAISAPAGERFAGARARSCSTDAAGTATASAAAAAAPLKAGDFKHARQGQPSARKEQVPQSPQGPELGGGEDGAVAAAGKAVPLLQQFAGKGPGPAELHWVDRCSSTRNTSSSNSKVAHSVPFAAAAPASVCAREPRPPCRGSSTAAAMPLAPVSVRPAQQQPCGASSSDDSRDNVQERGSNTHGGHRETFLEGRPNSSQHQMQENMHTVHAAGNAGQRASGAFLETRLNAPAAGQIPPNQCERGDLAQVSPALVEVSEGPVRRQGRPQRPELPSVVAAAAHGDSRAAGSRWSCLHFASPRAEETALVKKAPLHHQPHEEPSQSRGNEAEAPLMQHTEQQQVGVQQQQLVRLQPLLQPLLQQKNKALHPSQPHPHQSRIGPPQNHQCPQWQQEEQLQQQPQQRLQRASLQQQEYSQHQEHPSQKLQVPAHQLPRQHPMQHQRQHLLLQHEQQMLHRQEHRGGFPHPGSCFQDISSRSAASPVSPMSRLSPMSGASLNRRSPSAWVMRPAVGSRCSPVCGGASTAGGSDEWQTQPPCSSKGLRTCCVSPAFPRDPLARPAWLQQQRKSPHAVPLGPQGKAELVLAPQSGGAGVAMPCRAASKPASAETAQEAVVSLLKAGGPSIPQNARSRPESMHLQQLQQLQQHPQHQQQHLARQRQLRRVKHLFALHTRLHDLLSHAAVVLQSLRDVCCCSLETLSALEGASCCSPGGGVPRTKDAEDVSEEAGTPARATAAAGDGLCSSCNVHLNLPLENNGAENCVCPRTASPVDVSQAEHACGSATNRQQQQQQQQHNHHQHQHHQQSLPCQPSLHQRFVDTHLGDRTSASNQHQTLLQQQLLPRLQRQGQPQPLAAVQHLQMGKQFVQKQQRQHALQQHQQLHQQQHEILPVADGPVQPQQQMTKHTPQEGPLQPPAAHHHHIKGGQSLLLLQQVPLQQLQLQRAQKRQHLLLEEQLRRPSIHRPPSSQHLLADALLLQQMAVQKAQLQSSPEDLEHQQGSQEHKAGKQPSLRIPLLYSTEQPWLLQLPLQQPLQQPVQKALQPEPNPKKKFGPLQLGRDTQHAESAKQQRQLLQEQTDQPTQRQLLQFPLTSGVPHPPQQQPQPWSILQQQAQQKAHHEALQQVDAPNAGNNIAQPGDFIREQRPRTAHCHHFLLQTGAAEETGEKSATVSPQKPPAGDPLRSPTTPLTTAESSCGSHNSTSRTSSNSITSTNRINQETVSPPLRESGSAAERQAEIKDSSGSVSTCGPSVQPCGEETSGSRRQCYLDAMYRLPLRPKWWYTPLGLSSADRSIQ